MQRFRNPPIQIFSLLLPRITHVDRPRLSYYPYFADGLVLYLNVSRCCYKEVLIIQHYSQYDVDEDILSADTYCLRRMCCYYMSRSVGYYLTTHSLQLCRRCRNDTQHFKNIRTSSNLRYTTRNLLRCSIQRGASFASNTLN